MEESGYPFSFGDWLKGRRKALDLTQAELAGRAGCSVFALRKIEAGERRPSKQLAALLAAALEIPEEEQPLFVRVARGEVNLERLRQPAPAPPQPSLPEIATALKAEPPPAVQYHVPVPLTPLLGRETELAALERLFQDPQCRLLTLTGMGGIGKTRLALEFAASQRDLFPAGVFYVPLASLNAADLIVPAIAEALAFSFSGPVEPKEQLISYLAGEFKQPALLVLDNLEHLLAASPATVALVADLLQRLPLLKILTTSRERLDLHGEWMYELHGLPTPPSEHGGDLEAYSAVALFLHSARRINSAFTLTPAERPALVRICQLLEGIPLALELAAAWAGVLTCAEIAAEIACNVDFLATTMRDAPERHRSLRASFDHSWQLLSASERHALCRLALFQGGFDRTAAGRIAGATLPLLASLVAKSLVQRAENGRYDMHEAIRQFALSHLDAEPAACQEAQDAHSAYYLRFFADRERALKSAPQQETMRELVQEMDNLRAAWTWAIAHAQFARVGAAVRSLGWFFEVAGLISEGIDHFEPLVQTLRAQPAHSGWRWVLGQALTQQGLLCFRKGLFDRALALMEESLAVLRPLRNEALLTDVLVYLGIIMHLVGDMDRSRALIAEGLACAQSAGEEWFVAYGIYNLGYLDSLAGRYSEGYRQMMAGVASWRRLGDPHSIALGLNYLAPTLVKLGRYAEAETLLQESLTLCRASGNRWGLGTAYRYLGLAEMAQGHIDEAQALFHQSLRAFGGYIKGWDIARTSIYLAEAAMLSGDSASARRICLHGLLLARKIDSLPLVLDALAVLAQFDVAGGAPLQALTIAHFVLAQPAGTQETRDRALSTVAALEKQFSPAEASAIRERAASQSLAEMIGLFLDL